LSYTYDHCGDESGGGDIETISLMDACPEGNTRDVCESEDKVFGIKEELRKLRLCFLPS